MAQNTKAHPALGKMPKAAKGSCGPGMGVMPKGVDNTTGQNPTAYAGGKGHKSMGGGERKGVYPKAPKASAFTTMSDNPPTTKPTGKW